MITIKHAAVKDKNGKVYKGKSHADCFYQIPKELSVSLADYQGFLTNQGQFVSRQAAAEIALNANQIDYKTTLLFSENLWSQTDGGKYDYDISLGYYLKNIFDATIEELKQNPHVQGLLEALTKLNDLNRRHSIRDIEMYDIARTKLKEWE